MPPTGAAPGVRGFLLSAGRTAVAMPSWSIAVLERTSRSGASPRLRCGWRDWFPRTRATDRVHRPTHCAWGAAPSVSTRSAQVLKRASRALAYASGVHRRRARRLRRATYQSGAAGRPLAPAEGAVWMNHHHRPVCVLPIAPRPPALCYARACPSPGNSISDTQAHLQCFSCDPE